jgi:hypothetical protein
MRVDWEREDVRVFDAGVVAAFVVVVVVVVVDAFLRREKCWW